MLGYGIAFYGNDVNLRESRTTATLVLVVVGLWVLVLLARPFNWWKTLLVGSMVLAVALIVAVPALSDFYALELPPDDVLAEAGLVALGAIVLLEVGWRASRVVGRRRSHGVDDDAEGTSEPATASRAS